MFVQTDMVNYCVLLHAVVLEQYDPYLTKIHSKLNHYLLSSYSVYTVILLPAILLVASGTVSVLALAP